MRKLINSLLHLLNERVIKNDTPKFYTWYSKRKRKKNQLPNHYLWRDQERSEKHATQITIVRWFAK